MRISVYKYRLPLTQPLNLMGVSMTTREGFLVEFTDKNGVSGWGEVAPFPGLHHETLAGAKAQLLKFCDGDAMQILLDTCAACDDILSFNIDEDEDLYPSVRFGVEAAMLNFRAQQQGLLLANLLNPAARSEVSLNGLLTGERSVMLSNLQRLLAQRYPAIKVKVGRRSVAGEAAMINEISRQLPAGVQLRLDANRRWGFDDAVDFSQRVDMSRIEYVEEPLQNAAELAKLHEITRMPIALDESLVARTPENLQLFAGIVALVIKPAVVGGVCNALRWAKRAQNNRMSAVISSVFDSGVGIATLANIAAAVNDRDVPAGLDTYAWLAADVLKQPLTIENGKILLSDMPEAGEQYLNMQKLELVYPGV